MLYLIGLLFTFGCLITIDMEYEITEFNGFSGGCLLIFLCIIWPTTLGSLIVLANRDKE